MADCEKDLGRHTVINIISENCDEVPAEITEEFSALLTLINTENERMLKHIMKLCFCSKNGAEHILDELIDELGDKQPDEYYIEKAGLQEMLIKAGFGEEE